MTVQSQTSRADYTGNGLTTNFPVPFYWLQDSDLLVIRTDNSFTPPTVATLALGTDYVVTGSGNPAGGSITTTVAPTTTQKLSILRNVPFTQLTHYVPNDPFPAASHEQALDKLTMETQQLNEGLSRSLTLPPNTTGVSTALPTPVANNFIGWNPTATALQNVDPTTVATSVTYGNARADLFNGDGTTTVFNLSANPGGINNLDVSIAGVTQRPGVDYTWTTGITLTFTVAPPAGANNILVRYTQALPIGLIGAGQVTDTNIANPVIPSQGVQSSKLSFLQAGTGAAYRTVESRLRDELNVKDFGAVGDGVTDDTTAVQAAFNALNNSTRTSIYFPAGSYRVTSPLTITDKRVHLRGAGPQQATIQSEIASGTSLAISNTDFTQFVVVEGLTFTTNKKDLVDGLSITFSVADATNNRTQDRTTLRDLQFFGTSFGANGHSRGIVLTNVHAVTLEAINIMGSTYATGMAAGVDFLSSGSGAPADFVVHNVKVYYAANGFRGTGRLEGVNFSQCHAIAVFTGWNFQLSAPYPWFTLNQCHANVTSSGVVLNNFAQSFIANNLIYIVNNPSGGTAAGVYITSCDDTIIVGNNVVNTSPASGATVNSYTVSGSQRVKLSNNKAAGYNNAFTILGASDYCETFDNETSTPYSGAVVYADSSGSLNNRRRATPILDAKNSGPGTSTNFGASGVGMVTVSSDVTSIGDLYFVTGTLRAVKDATAASVQALIIKSAGTANIVFNGNYSSIRGSDYAAGGSEVFISLAGVMRVTSGGSLDLQLQGYTNAGQATTSAGDAQLSVVRL